MECLERNQYVKHCVALNIISRGTQKTETDVGRCLLELVTNFAVGKFPINLKNQPERVGCYVT